MALSDKDIIITPNRGQSADPKIEFRGAGASTGPFTITAQMYPDNNGTLSFEGSAGQLFSITNNLSGTIFSVSDVSGIPSIEVDADGTISLAEFGGNVGIGTSSPDQRLSVAERMSFKVGGTTRGVVGSPAWDTSYIALQNGTLALTAANTAISQSSLGTTIVNAASGQFIRFSIGNAEKARIDSNGNVGIGTSNPLVGLVVNTTDAIGVPVGTDAQRPTGATGYLRFNSTSSQFEGYDGSAWAAIGGAGGSGQFNTNITSSVGYTITNLMAAAFTAPSTTGLRYIVYSVHVTNISADAASVSGEFSGTTYSNISFALSIPVPAGSSVELLKQPKIMQPSDILNMQGSVDGALHVTITYETQTSTSLFGVGVDITTDATYTDLYTASLNCVLQSLLLANDDGVNDVKARVVWTNSINAIQGYYCYDLIVPADSTIDILDQPKYLAEGNKVRVYANVGGRLEAILAGKVI